MSKNKLQLINNIIGQLQGVRTMMEEDKECFEILNQMKAAKSGLNSLMNKFLEEHFVKCMNDCKGNRGKQEETCKKYFAEILKNG
jgi:CsoR family transcriptional regulator, copper-sensing transcriptional repressor